MKNKTPFSSIKLLLLALFAFAPFMAQAHPGHGLQNGFTGGFNHPLHGMDHILAMVAVGLWAAQLGGRALWMVPLSFVSLMIVGGSLGMSGVHLPMVEAGILASVFILGILIASAARLPLAVSMAIVGVFALFHGHAHGTEIPMATSGIAYAIGFVVATAILHLGGIGLGLLGQHRMPPTFMRFAGAAIIVGGVCLCFA